jgi:hypothetical protein
MEDRKLTEKESEELISIMIKNTRINQRAKFNCNILLTWGYISFFVSLLVWIFKTTHIFQSSSLIWLLIPLICIPVLIYQSNKDKGYTKSYIDKLIEYISILFLLVCADIAFVIGYLNPVVTLPIEGILLSMWAVIIGLLIKYKPIIYGGILGIIAAHELFFIDNTTNQIPFFVIIIAMSLIIPAHLLKNSIKKNS